MGDCAIRRVSFGHLVCIAQDYGEWLKIPTSLPQKLQIQTAIEGNNVRPSMFRHWGLVCRQQQETGAAITGIGKETCKEIRLSEYNDAAHAINQIGTGATNLTEYELSILIHDVRTGHRDRDYRGFCLFAGQFMRDDGCALRAFGAISGENGNASLQINVLRYLIKTITITLICWPTGDICIGFDLLRKLRDHVGSVATSRSSEVSGIFRPFVGR